MKTKVEGEVEMANKIRKTLIAVLASHDSVQKNNELADLFEELYDQDNGSLGAFHFIFTGGTFSRVILGKDTVVPERRDLKSIREDVSKFIGSNATVLPGRDKGGVAILANLIVQRQCSIIWPFLSPITVHWLNPENLALMRLCDLRNAKRLMNAESVRTWFRDEAQRDIKRNPQEIPVKIALGTPEKDGSWPVAEREVPKEYHEVKLPERKRHPEEFWSRFEDQTIALIAHDAMKDRMVDFAIQYENELSRFRRILATGTTAQ